MVSLAPALGQRYVAQVLSQSSAAHHGLANLARTLHVNLSRRTIDASSSAEVWNQAEISQNLRGLKGALQILRFGDVRVHLDNVNEALSPRPQIAARLLSHGRAAAVDSTQVREILWWDLFRFALESIDSQLAWGRIFPQIQADLASINGPAPYTPGGEGLVAIRSDLWFGLEAGGAVAHTAGIFNALEERVRPLRLVSAHKVPTLSETIDYVTPVWRRYARPEHALLAFNRDLISAALKVPAPRFVYQRSSLYGYAGAILARHWKKPLIVEFNGSEVWVGDHWGTPVAARDVALDIERRILGAATIVTAVSQPALEQAVERGADRQRTLLLPNAVDTDRYRPDRDGQRIRELYKVGDSVVIGFIGSFGLWHGAPLLARAFVELRRKNPQFDVRLLMIGDGVERPAAEQAIVEAGMAEFAIFTGLVPQAQGPDHLAAADVLVSPTMPNPDGREFFGSPTKIYEYMAMGRAIVASEVGQMRDVLRNGESALLTEAGSVESLVQALGRVCGDAELRQRLGEGARLDVVKSHTWAARIETLVGALDRLRS